MGFTKTPDVYGAFPTDPYSHSPRHRGAQQPGMTGQVKEEIITRFGELGVEISGGCLRFNPRNLRRAEFFKDTHVFAYVNAAGEETAWELTGGQPCIHLSPDAGLLPAGRARRPITIERAGRKSPPSSTETSSPARTAPRYSPATTPFRESLSTSQGKCCMNDDNW